MTADLARLVRDHIEGRHVAVAFSGGVDSSALLHSLVASGVRPCAIHVDHGLRPDSSRDAEFCRRQAARLGVVFETVRLTVDPGNSTQSRARHQRYAALVRAASRLGADVLATAHHLDDAVETMLLQTARGAGAIGRAGPLCETHWAGFPVTRPLLRVSRLEIEEYIENHRVPWTEDPTNRQLDYERNRVRARLGHELDRDEAMQALRQAREERGKRERAAATLFDHAVVATAALRTSFDAEALRRADAVDVGRVLLDTVVELGGELRGSLVEQIHDALAHAGPAAKRFCGSRVVVEVTPREVVIEATRGRGTGLLDARATPEIRLPLGEELPWFALRLVAAKRPAIEGLVLRGHRRGERIDIGGGSKLISRVLAEARIPPSARWWWPCIYLAQKCISVLGVRVAPNYSADLLPDAVLSGIFDRS